MIVIWDRILNFPLDLDLKLGLKDYLSDLESTRIHSLDDVIQYNDEHPSLGNIL